MSILLIGVALLLYFHVWYLISLLFKDFGVVDMAWGPGFFLVGLLSIYPFQEINPQQILVVTMVGIWALRLFAYIFLRHKKKEDWRYAKWRKEWGAWANIRAYFQVFLLQFVILMILSSPLQFILKQKLSLWGTFSWIGLILFVVGFLWESVADYQMLLFKRQKKHEGEILNRGLWLYSRHPNYFGESLVWWGIAFFSLPYPYGWIFLLAPALLTLFLLKVSGVSLLESKYRNHQSYQQYKESTNAFFPWFPKK